MAKKLSLDEVKAKADEYAELTRKIERAEKAAATEIDAIVKRHEEELLPVAEKHSKKLAPLQEKADALRKEVFGWMASKKTFFAASTDLVEFGVEVGTKPGPRVIDRKKLADLCKAKAVDIWECVTVAIGKAEELLGKKEIDAISEKPKVPTRDEYLNVKEPAKGTK